MRLINVIFAAGIVAFIVITHQALQVQLSATDDLIRLNDAERYAEDADRLHDNLRGDLYAALLEPRMNQARSDDLMQSWQREVGRFRDDLEHQSKLVLGAEVERNVALTRERAEQFLVRSEDLMTGATEDQSSVLARIPDFEKQFTELGGTFDNLNTLLSEEIDSAKQRASVARDDADRSILLAAGLIIGGTLLLAWTIMRSIGRSVQDVSAVARSLAHGELDVRYEHTTSHEVGEIGASLNVMADSLQGTLQKMTADSKRDRFNKQVAEAFEIADSESDIAGVVAHAMASISARHPMELLLAGTGQSDLTRVAEHPTLGSPNCGVKSSAKCVAVRRGNTVVYPNSDELNSCPYLKCRPTGPTSAVCVPLSFMGKSLGVLHAASSIGEPAGDTEIASLETLALNAGTRTGTVRAFERTQLQALTDSMTGLLNRRGLETQAREQLRAGRKFALVIADLDHFKRLNDTSGHHVGDRALQLFADVMRSCLRAGDHAARWGGEEFVVMLLDASAVHAEEWVERVRGKLAADCDENKMPAFTASFGIADSAMSTQFAALLRVADAALYMSKVAGRDRATVGSADMALEPDDVSKALAERVEPHLTAAEPLQRTRP